MTRLFLKERFLSYWVNEELNKIPLIIKPKKNHIGFLSNQYTLILIFVTPCIIMLIIGALGGNNVSSLNGNFYTSIVTILASLIVIVVMALVFMLEANRISVPGANNLLNVIARNNYYMPIIAWVMGTILSGIVFPFIASNFSVFADSFNARLIFLIISSLGLILLFVLSIRFFLSLGINYLYEQLGDALIKKQRIAFNNAIKWRTANNIFIKKLEKYGFNWGPLWKTPLEHQKSYKIYANGRLFDIDFKCLQELKACINKNQNNLENDVIIATSLGESINDSKNTILIIPKSLEVNDEDIYHILDKCFFYKKEAAAGGIWDELSSLIFEGMRSYDLSKSKKSLSVLENLVKDYLYMVKIIQFEHIDSYSYEVSIHNFLPPSLKLLIIEHGFTEVLNSNIKLEELLLLAKKVVIEAWKHGNNEYLEETLQGISYLYREFVQPGHRNNIKSIIIVNRMHDMYIYTIGYKLDYQSIFPIHKKPKKEIGYLIPYYFSFLRANLIIARRAIEYDNFEGFDSAVENFLIYSEKTKFIEIRRSCLRVFNKLKRCEQEEIAEGLEVELNILNDYIKVRNSAILAEFAVYAWANLLSNTGVLANRDIIENMNNNALKRFEGLNGLINILLFRGITHERNELVDDEIGYGSWDNRSIKSYVIYQRLDPDDWLIDYWISLALKVSLDKDLDEKIVTFYDEYNEYDYEVLLKRVEDVMAEDHPMLKSDIDNRKTALIELIKHIKQLHSDDSNTKQFSMEM